MIQLISQGPQIPEEIERALRDNRLVFFCGAGISVNNGLPLFTGLVNKVCKKLNINVNDEPLLEIAQKKEDYAGILDLIEGSQSFSVPKQTLRKKIITILSEYRKDQFENHKALLDLSALQNGKGNRLVTTNFDRLFFEAKPDLSFDSAPKLVLPREETWINLTFLHGVIDKYNDPEGKNLILTRRDFGLAYLHDHWASKFIIQLFQNFTVLFVGYSINDPVMNYLVSAISYENQRRNEIKPSIYAFAGYQENEREAEENKWKALGIEPIPYKVKQNDDHTFLYESIKKWAELKRTGLTGWKVWLKEQLKTSYNPEIDRKKAETVISSLKTNEKLAEYFPEINLSSDPNKKKPVDISWLKAFTKNSLLEKLTRQTARSSLYCLWESLLSIEKNIVEWILHHLDRKEIIHWLIKQAPIQNGLISLHPEFKDMLKRHLEGIQKNNTIQLDERKLLFWKIISTQKEQSNMLDSLIGDLNETYSYEKAIKLLSCLEPMVGFKRSFYNEKLKQITGPDKIYEAKLTINVAHYPYENLENEKMLLSHAEDFSNLLKKTMELAQWAGIFHNGHDSLFITRSSIDEHEQNKKYHPWTYLIDLVRDSFDLAMKKDKKLAKFLIDKWQFYPYSIFYRLILYAVTKHSDLDEKTAVKLLEEKPDQTLWSVSCQREVLKFLRDRKHLEKNNQKILSLIMSGPPRDLYENIEDSFFNELKERKMYHMLNQLKISGVELNKDIENKYNKIQKKYKIQEKEFNDKSDFPFYHTGPKQIGYEKRYHNLTDKEIFNDIKDTQANAYPSINNKLENFRCFVRDFPNRAFKVLSMFSDNNINSSPYWGVFIFEVSMLANKKQFIKAIEKIEKFDDIFFKECKESLWSLIHGFDLKAVSIYNKDKAVFEKYWQRLFDLSVQNQEAFTKSDFATIAINSNLGKLTQSVFSVLWSKFPGPKIPKAGKIPEEIKKYFKLILQEKVIKKDRSVLFHFGSHLSRLWYLDKKWTMEKIKPFIDWSKTNPFYKTSKSYTNLIGNKDNSEDYNLCKPLWQGYLLHDMFLNPDLLEDFKKEFFELLINYKKILTDNYKIEYTERLSDIFFTATGGMQIKNAFTDEKKQKIIQNIDTDILESLSRQIWYLLKDSGDKSGNLWSEKIKPWIEKFWPSQTKKMNSEIAENLSFVILHCGDKLPEAFKVLKDKIEGVIKNNSNYMAFCIVKNKGNNQTNLEHIYNYPKELLQILDWNFPEDKIYYNRDEKIKRILNKLKKKYPDIEENEQYQKLLNKIT